MLFDVIPVLLIFLAVVVIAAIVLRRLPDISTLNIETIAEAQNATAKRQLLAERLGRKLTSAASQAWQSTSTARQTVAAQAQKYYDQLLEWEKRTKAAKASKEPLPLGDRAVATLLADAERAREENRDDAEAMYLEVIRMDHRNASAYFGLGLFYAAHEQHEEARQALEYAARIDKKNPEFFAKLAEVATIDGRHADALGAFSKAAALDPMNIEYPIGIGDAALALEDYAQAVSAFEAAVALEPSNPRCLDRLLEACILLGNKRLATTTLKRLEEVNPENHKLLEFQKRIAAMPSRSKVKV